MLACIEAGYRIGANGSPLSEEASSAVGIIKGAVLGLLGLLLAFSFSLASTRYDMRRELVVQEANAIGTAYLRGQLLAEPVRASYEKDLRAYTDNRLAYFAAGVDQARIEATYQELSLIQARLWQLTTAETRLHPDAAHTSVITSLNELFDTSAARNAARVNEVPPPLIGLLLVLVAVSALFAGHSFGTARYRDPMSAICFSVLVAIVLFAVFDLDRPRRGWIRVSQQPMFVQRASMRP